MSSQSQVPPLRPRPLWVFPLFFVSGASALILQIVWQRMLILVFGASATATTAILTAFFCGIAFGSLIAGRLLRRFENALVFYAWVEAWIMAWGLLVPILLRVADHFYVGAFSALEPGPDEEIYGVAAHATRFFLSVLVVLPATLGMGATVPIMNRLLSDLGLTVGRSVGFAYGFNTIGSVLGCLLTGFLLIRTLGVQNTLFVAAACNGVVALCSFALRQRLEGRWSELVAPIHERRRNEWFSPLLVIYFFTGFTALGFEVVWFRLLGIFNVNSVTTFTLLLSTYLLGFSLGSLVLFPILSRRLRNLTLFALSNWGVGVSVLSLVPAYYSFKDISQRLVYEAAAQGTLSQGDIVITESLFSCIMMFIPTLFMGLAYPALCGALIDSNRHIGQKSGFYYFTGTLGSMLGAFAVGTFLITGLGLVKSLAALSAGSIALGALVFVSDSQARGSKTAFFFQLSSAFFLCVAFLYGAYGHPFVHPFPEHRGLQRVGDHWRLIPPKGSAGALEHRYLRYQEGPTATVMVREERRDPAQPGDRVLIVDGQEVASTYALVDSKMLAHLPLLLHPAPENALTVGFGSGGTSWSMTTHDVETYCVDIEPEVPNSADFFESQNHGVKGLPNFHLIVNDARDHLHLTQRLYDVISTDVTNLRYKQNGNLYSREYFALMKARLTENGIACAWVPMSAISKRDFRILLKSFAAVFPHTTLWYMNHSLTDFGIFIGTPEPLKIDLERLHRGFEDPDVRGDLADIGMTHPYQFVHALHLDEEGVHRYVGDVPLHIDDRPVLEFGSPVAFYNKDPLFIENLEATLKHRPSDYRRYVTDLRAGEGTDFKRYRRAAQLWTETALLFYKARNLRYSTHRELKAKLRTRDGRNPYFESPLSAAALEDIRVKLDDGLAGLQKGDEALGLAPQRLAEQEGLLKTLYRVCRRYQTYLKLQAKPSEELGR